MQALTANDYTAESWVALSEALAAAKTAAASPAQAEIDAALASLQAAHRALVELDATPTPPAEPAQPSTLWIVLVLGAVVLIGAAVAAIILVKNRKNR